MAPTREETAVPPAREAEVRSQFSTGFLRVWGWGCRGGVRVGGEGRQIEKRNKVMGEGKRDFKGGGTGGF